MALRPSRANMPNTIQFDQLVVGIGHFPEPARIDPTNWATRAPAIYGETYRYTTSYGVPSYQFLKKIDVKCYALPMVYAVLCSP